jgi:oligopeptide/dipeptide ABC transporter ATP-binding protein
LSEPLLRVRSLTVDYRSRSAGRLGRNEKVRALDGVSLELRDGRSLGIVGESGSGKSTLARAVLGLVPASAGSIEWRGREVHRGQSTVLRELRRELQVVFQDPFGSLDPRMTIGESVGEALQALEGTRDRLELRGRVAAALEEVGLAASLATRFPHQLSGGQCQRAAIARATIARPRLLICDEAVSALDVSVQAQIVNLLKDLSRRHGMSLLFISHNLAVVRHTCDDVAVLFDGRVVERASRESLFAGPAHPYTLALLAAVPKPVPGDDPLPAGIPPADVEPASTGPGCAYRSRCGFADPVCSAQSPPLTESAPGHLTACHHPGRSPR